MGFCDTCSKIKMINLLSPISHMQNGVSCGGVTDSLSIRSIILFLFHCCAAMLHIEIIYKILVSDQAASCDPPAPEESGVVAPTSKKQTVLINAHICEHCHEVCRCTQVSVTTVSLKRLLSVCQTSINVPQGCLLFVSAWSYYSIPP